MAPESDRGRAAAEAIATGRSSEVLAGMRGTALVQRGGSDILRYAGGTTGGDPDSPIGIGTRFQIASVSKQFTAAAVLLLADRGESSVNDRLVELLAGSPSSWSEITVHQLLCHTAGLVHWPQLPQLDLTAPVSADVELELFHQAPLLSAPGTTYEYSSPGYVLLAHIVERVSKKPYRDFLREEIFTPLGLRSTFAGNGADASDRATPLHAGEPVPSFELDVVGMGAGDVWSTVDDLATWDVALKDGLLLSDESRRAMFTVHTPVNDEIPGLRLRGYGYGWYMADIEGHPVVFHAGGNAVFQSINATLPEADARFIALLNDTDADLVGTAFSLLAVALDWK